MIAALVAATLAGVMVGACVGAVAAQQVTYQAVKWLTRHTMDKQEAPAPVNREAGASFAVTGWVPTHLRGRSNGYSMALRSR